MRGSIGQGDDPREEAHACFGISAGEGCLAATGPIYDANSGQIGAVGHGMSDSQPFIHESAHTP